MSSTPGHQSLRARRVAAEAIGTFFLVLIGPGSAMVNAYSGGSLGQVGIALAFAFVVVSMIYALGHLSGAHINPAVTLAFWSARRFPTVEVVPYVLAQCAGAVTASLCPSSRIGSRRQHGSDLARHSCRSGLRGGVVALVRPDVRDHGGGHGRAGGRRVRGFGRRSYGGLLRADGWGADGCKHEPRSILRSRTCRRPLAGTLAVLALADQRYDRGGAHVRSPALGATTSFHITACRGPGPYT